MSISAIQNNSIYQAPEVQKAQPVPASQTDQEAREERIVPEERAFDCYEPEDRTEITVCDTGKVDRELENLRKRQEDLTQQLRSAGPEQAEDIQRQLDQVNRELSQKDNDSYRRQHAVFS